MKIPRQVTLIEYILLRHADCVHACFYFVSQNIEGADDILLDAYLDVVRGICPEYPPFTVSVGFTDANRFPMLGCVGFNRLTDVGFIAGHRQRIPFIFINGRLLVPRDA
ncbi:hypothetical protein SDC9_122533 [bioreactor metagenome]|uniref:Uncharacterized protein n=1 Tax=bioreactor metagenome TaxID=1076179 RepID=A0A645CF48_9ZZZZ